MLNSDLKPVIEKFGKEIIVDLVFELLNKDAKASLTLINSLDFELSSAVNQIILSITAEDYFKYIDEGRKPGKTPPISKIVEWTKYKNIDSKLAFPIARKIGKFGIQPRNILLEIIKEQELKIEGKLSDDIYLTVQKKIDELFI